MGDVNSKLILPFLPTSEKLAHTHMKLNLKLEKDHSMSPWLFMKTIPSPRSPIQTMKSLCQTISTLVSVETISVTLVTLLSPRTVGSPQTTMSITQSNTMLSSMVVQTQMMLTIFWSLRMELVTKPDSVSHHSSSSDRHPDSLFMDIVKFTFVIQMLRLAHHHATEAENDVMQMMIPQAQLSPLA